MSLTYTEFMHMYMSAVMCLLGCNKEGTWTVWGRLLHLVPNVELTMRAICTWLQVGHVTFGTYM